MVSKGESPTWDVRLRVQKSRHHLRSLPGALGSLQVHTRGPEAPPRPKLPGSSSCETPLHLNPLHLSQSLHPNITCRPGAADSMHPGLITHGGGCLQGPKWESRKDRTIPSLNRTPCFKSQAPSPKSFAALLTQQPPGLLSPSLSPGPPAHAISLLEAPLAYWQHISAQGSIKPPLHPDLQVSLLPHHCTGVSGAPWGQ